MGGGWVGGGRGVVGWVLSDRNSRITRTSVQHLEQHSQLIIAPALNSYRPRECLLGGCSSVFSESGPKPMTGSVGLMQ